MKKCKLIKVCNHKKEDFSKRGYLTKDRIVHPAWIMQCKYTETYRSQKKCQYDSASFNKSKGIVLSEGQIVQHFKKTKNGKNCC